MSHEIDLSFLDLPEILSFMFPLAYYFQFPSSLSSARPGTYMIEVDKGIQISSIFYARSKQSPTVLYFHGNGETASDYRAIADIYNQMDINLFVADYRGYGRSNGKPTISNLLKDPHPIFQEFKKIVSEAGFTKKIFVMGRSIGCIPAIELAHHYQSELSGLIVESGMANNFKRWAGYLKPQHRKIILNENGEFLNKVKARSISIPVLVIHSEYDTIIPLEEGKELHENIASKDKKMVIIHNADHNDLMTDQYFQAIGKFVREALKGK